MIASKCITTLHSNVTPETIQIGLTAQSTFQMCSVKQLQSSAAKQSHQNLFSSPNNPSLLIVFPSRLMNIYHFKQCQSSQIQLENKDEIHSGSQGPAWVLIKSHLHSVLMDEVGF